MLHTIRDRLGMRTVVSDAVNQYDQRRGKHKDVNSRIRQAREAKLEHDKNKMI